MPKGEVLQNLPQGQRDREFDFFTILRLFWSNKWRILFFVLLAQGIAIYMIVYNAKPVYKSGVTLALQIRSEQIVDIESVFSGVSTETSAINTELLVIESRGILEILIEQLDLRNDPEFNGHLNAKPSVIDTLLIKAGVRQEPTPMTKDEMVNSDRALDLTIESLNKAISVVNLKNTYVFVISVRAGDRNKAALIANTLADIYIQNQIDVKFQATENAVVWLLTRVGKLREELEAKQDAVIDLRASMELSTPEELSALVQQNRSLKKRLEGTELKVAGIREQIANAEFVKATGDLAKIAEFYKDPLLDRLLGQVNDGQTDRRSLFDDRVDGLMRQLQQDLARELEQAKTLTQSVETLGATVDEATIQMTELNQMTGEVEATRALFETFVARLKEASVQRGLQQADSRVLSKATLGQQVAPRRMVILAVYSILGFIIGALNVVYRDFSSKGFMTSQELATETGHTVLGQVPKMPFRKRSQLIDYLNDNPTSHSAEAVRNLRTSLLLSNVDKPPKLIMSTSSLPGEGKTTQSIALAHNLAGLGKRILLVECDIRRRTFAEYFKVSEGSTNFLEALEPDCKLEDVIMRDPRIDIDILVGAKTSISATDLFSSEKFGALLKRLKVEYDYVILDTPPVLVVPDARVVGQHVDSILFSVAWNKTTQEQVSDALQSFESVNLKIQGLVLSMFDEKAMSKNGYGSYSTYGSKYYDI